MDGFYINGTFFQRTELEAPIRNIQYRGVLNYCNYSCSYCPFSKKTYSPKKETADRNSLFRLLEKLEKLTEPFTFQIVPYGEALIHPYYWEFLGELSRMEQVKAVGCQTNASFPVKEMFSVFQKHHGILEKLRLWCSFHPTMISAENFFAQIQELKKYDLELCVGAVADVSKKKELSRLRSLLPENIYFWLNQMDGRKKAYTTEERVFFESIDPFFPLEETHIPAEPQICQAGFTDTKRNSRTFKDRTILPDGNFFMEADGTVYACNISKHVLGNLYENNLNPTQIKCSRRECSCFLAYQNNLSALPELLLFFPYPAFRIVKCYQAAFFDIDNTLVMEQETEISEKTVKILSVMSRYCDIYLATSLPYAAAMKKCHAIRQFLSGGIFAEGAHIRLFSKTEHTLSTEEKEFYLFMKENDCSPILEHYKNRGFSVRIYRVSVSGYMTDTIYKITVFPGNRHFVLSEDDLIPVGKTMRIYLENNHIQITNANAGKKNGVQSICNHKGYNRTKILTCGDSKEDQDM